MIIELQPTQVYIGLMITGLFIGIGSAIGSVIVKVWLEPRIEKWRDLQAKITEKITKKPDVKDSVIFKRLVVQNQPPQIPIMPKRGRPKKMKD